MTHSPLNILRLDASARKTGSVSRQLTDRFIDQLAERRDVHVNIRDLSETLPLINEDWIGANFTPENDRSEEQRAHLDLSDQLVGEIEAADLLVIGTPIYNFSVPAALKAWIDLIARAGKTFRYTESGPIGLLENKRAVILLASGGTGVGSEIDFATPYLKHVLGFVGIKDVHVIAADQLMMAGEDKIAASEHNIEEHVLSLAA